MLSSGCRKPRQGQCCIDRLLIFSFLLCRPGERRRINAINKHSGASAWAALAIAWRHWRRLISAARLRLRHRSSPALPFRPPGALCVVASLLYSPSPHPDAVPPLSHPRPSVAASPEQVTLKSTRNRYDSPSSRYAHICVCCLSWTEHAKVSLPISEIS